MAWHGLLIRNLLPDNYRRAPQQPEGDYSKREGGD
jgi:hypothetical protein